MWTSAPRVWSRDTDKEHGRACDGDSEQQTKHTRHAETLKGSWRQLEKQVSEPRCHTDRRGGRQLPEDGHRDTAKHNTTLGADLALDSMHSKVMAVTAGAGGGSRGCCWGLRGGG